eukprot:5086785-Pyramimonas_sp.AAC.1
MHCDGSRALASPSPATALQIANRPPCFHIQVAIKQAYTHTGFKAQAFSIQARLQATHIQDPTSTRTPANK